MLHALTAGAICTLTLSMMCRVTLGHTSRGMVARRATVLAFVLMQAAALMRVFGPLFMPGHYAVWVCASGSLWALCLALYMAFNAPMLWQSRPDGEAT